MPASRRPNCRIPIHTADIFTEIARGIDIWLSFVETSQQAIEHRGFI
jgi:hypothetical protein